MKTNILNKTIKNWFCKMNMSTIVLVALISVGCLSCGNTTDNEIDGGSYSREYSDYEERMISELTGTSWRYDKLVNGANTRTEYAIITFAENGRLQIDDYKKTDGKYISTNEGAWYFNNNILVFLCHVPDNIADAGYLSAALGVNHEISSITSSSMILVDSDGKDTRYFSRVSYRDIENKTPGGSTSYGDAPHVIDFTFTATKTSITVKFMCSEKPNNATISFGEGSATKTLSSTIAGKQVSATATGLKPGTKYYFKCKVSNQNGSSTSDSWPAMTNY